MGYRVVWTPYAEAQLGKLAAEAEDAKEIAAAARAIDRQLIHAPGAVGESREGDLRVGFVDPLGVQFEVMRDVQTVIVHDLWRAKRK